MKFLFLGIDTCSTLCVLSTVFSQFYIYIYETTQSDLISVSLFVVSGEVYFQYLEKYIFFCFSIDGVDQLLNWYFCGQNVAVINFVRGHEYYYKNIRIIRCNKHCIVLHGV